VPITEQHTEESLCFAHIYALAGIAGVNYSADRYDYGIDGRFTPIVRRGSRLVPSGFPLDYQAKATIDWELREGKIVYDLEAKTYNDLVGRTPAETSIILVLLCLPTKPCFGIAAIGTHSPESLPITQIQRGYSYLRSSC
jgi:hypothetical protein